MKWKLFAAAALAFSIQPAAFGQNTTSETLPPASELETPPPPPPTSSNQVAPEPVEALPAPTPAPEPQPAEPVQTIETVEAPEIINPYANSYNELLPVETEEERGFDDWGLLGLLGFLGLFGLKRRDRIVYAERLERTDRRD